MRIVVSGGSGFIGSALVPALRGDGHDVRRLVRRLARSPDESAWDPAAGRLDPAALAGVDAVVHLGGAGIGDRRWSAAYRRELRDSRVVPTRLISETIAALDEPPRVLLCASAVGFYGDTGERAVDETAPPGSGLLPDICHAWEQATGAAEVAGVRVCRLRSGVVLAATGGALARMLPVFRLGLGGRLGSGRQWFSWIALRDEIDAIRFLLTADVHGAVNLTAPEPVRGAEFTRALGRALRRPAVLAVPAPLLRIAIGGAAGELTASQRVLPGVLEDAGFPFSYPDVDAALGALV